MPSARGLPGLRRLLIRDTTYREGPIPDARVEDLASPSLVVRAPSETTGTSIAAAGASHTCGPHDNTGFCQKYVSANTETLPIVLGVVIPLVGAFVVFLFLHRRHKKKLKKEDEDDAHKSLDFGLGESQRTEKPGKKGRGGKKNKNIPEMSTQDAISSVRRERGLSMDLDAANPYLLPPGLEQSRESLHSLSRTLNMGDDKYRSSGFIPNDGSHSYPSSLRSPRGDDGSSFTGTSSRRFDAAPNQGPWKQGNNMSGSQSRNQSAGPMDRKPLGQPRSNHLMAPGNDTPRDSYMSTNSSIGPNAALRASHNYLGQFISGGASSDKKESDRARKQGSNLSRETTPTEETPQLPEKAVLKDNSSPKRETIAPFAPPKEELAATHHATTVEEPRDTREPRIPSMNFSDSTPLSTDFSMTPGDLKDSQPSQHQPRSETLSQYSANIRPDSNALPESDGKRETRQPTLPVLDLPHLAEHEQHELEHPTQQAEEDDDYYDDYYDEEDENDYDPHRATAMGDRPLPPDDPSENPEQRANRIRSFYKEYFDDTTNAPRMPPKQVRQDYYDGSENFAHDGYGVDQYHEEQAPHPSARGPSRQPRFSGPEGRHRATVSSGSYNHGQYPRAFSSASGRFGPPARRAPPKKSMPPPKPLMTLPTPHMLKDDNFLPIDFAPPGAFKGQRSGTPDSLRGEMKPYRAQRSHTPLASSFDDLTVMPSP